MPLRPFAAGTAAHTALLGAVSGLIAFSVDICLPALPLLVGELGTSTQTAQLVLGLFLVGFACGQMVWGPVADRFGRRPAALAGLAVYVAGGIACSLAPDIEALVAARGLQGFGTAAGSVVAPAIVRDLFAREQGARRMSQVMLAVGIAPLIAPTVGGVILLFAGWRAIFVALAVVGVAVAAVALLSLGESLKAPDPDALKIRRLATNARRFFTTRSAVANGAIRASSFAAMYAYISGSPFVLIDGFRVPEWAYGLFFASTAALLMVGAAINSRTVARRGVAANRRAAVTVAACAGVAALVLALLKLEGTAGVLAAMAPVWVFICAYGVLSPNATTGALEKLPDMAGLAGALMGAMQMAFGAVVGWLVARGYDGSALSMAAGLFAMTATAFAIDRLALGKA